MKQKPISTEQAKQAEVASSIVSTLRGAFPNMVEAKDLPKADVIPADPHSVEK